MHLILENYQSQSLRWPAAGRHILAQVDERSVVVYQAYRPAIGAFATRHGRLGGGFSFGRMTWIKPGFAWMMFRSGWGTKENQEVVLAIRLARAFFDDVLAAAVPSRFDAGQYASGAEWQAAVASSEVRLQWDPDHHPKGAPLARRAIQLGVRGATLRRMNDAILEIADLTPLVAAQRAVLERGAVRELQTPVEHVYRPASAVLCARLGLDHTARG